MRNITDIEDKIIIRAKELKVTWQDLIKKYIERYDEDLKALGIEEGDFEPRATQNISDMIKYIEGLVAKGYAYATDSGVYFSVRKFKGYGQLSGQGIDQMLTGVRKEPDETKEDPLDFALWKKSKPEEPSWPSPWGEGRPGWHIECSVMAQKFLKADTLDIHAGGRDLIFPHHENEIAQAEASTGKPFAKYWIHHGLLTINGQKMAKSLGNFVTIKDFMEKYKNADLLKLFFLSTHYSHPIDYNDKKIEEAKQALERILILLDKIDKEVPSKKFQEIEEIKDKFVAAMDDDFNTPQGLAALFELVNAANKNIDNAEFVSSAQSLLFELKDILGLKLQRMPAAADLSTDVTALIEKRNAARKKGDFKEADRIRKELEESGIILEDTKDGKTSWRKKL